MSATAPKSSFTVPALVFSCALSLLAGIGGTVIYFTPPTTHEGNASVTPQSDGWIALSADNSSPVFSYASEAVARSDIKMPAVTSLTGKSKFVSDASNTKQEIKLGYVVDATIAPLDTAAVVDTYKEVSGEGQQGSRPSIKAVDYDVVFYFILKDKDGFPLMKVASNREAVHSGMNNHFQLYAKTYIPQSVASATKTITVRMEAVRCLTCRDERGHSRSPFLHF